MSEPGGSLDDAESSRAIACALDMGITLFDTADAYGTGHGERVLGQALKARRNGVLVATKFGNTFDVARRELTGTDVSPDYIRRACEASLRRLGTDWIDLYQLHLGDLPLDQAESVADSLDRLCGEGLIRAYGWSTDDPVRGRLFAGRRNAAALQFDLNVFQDASEMMQVCARSGFTALLRAPLAMGFLSGKFSPDTSLAPNDIRSRPPDWLPYFEPGGGASQAWLSRLSAVRDVLASEGRTLAQGALAWIWAKGENAIPIPGARTAAQVEENAGAMAFGPLSPMQLEEIDGLLGR